MIELVEFLREETWRAGSSSIVTIRPPSGHKQIRSDDIKTLFFIKSQHRCVVMPIHNRYIKTSCITHVSMISSRYVSLSASVCPTVVVWLKSDVFEQLFEICLVCFGLIFTPIPQWVAIRTYTPRGSVWLVVSLAA